MRYRATSVRAFTIIELLIVVGILALLAAIAGFAMNGLMSRMKATSTHTTLENLKSMVTELSAVAHGLTRQPDQAYVITAAVTPASQNNPPFALVTPTDFWNDAWPTGSYTTPATADPFPVPTGNFSVAAAASPSVSPRYIREAMFNTQKVMGLLQQAPNNKKMLAQLPASQLMEALPKGTSTAGLKVNFVPNADPNLGPVASPAMVLDGWGNPIMFVPGGGLSGVWQGYRSGDVTVAANYDNANATVASPDKRPFWVSAGPDGNFQTGDDNVYSFQD